MDLPNDIPLADYWKLNIYYPVIDTIITNKDKDVNNLFKLDVEGADEFIINF